MKSLAPNGLTRRFFLLGLPALTYGGSAVASVMMKMRDLPGGQPLNAPVVSFHMDRAYVDFTGTAEIYRRAPGVRSAHLLAEMSDEQYRQLNPFG